MFHKRIEEQPKLHHDADKKTLIFTRTIGHKEDMPGSGQWKIITHENVGQNECYICDR